MLRSIPTASLLIFVVLACSGDDSADYSLAGDTQVDSALENIPLNDEPPVGGPLRLVVDTPMFTIGINPANDAEEFGYITEGILLADGSAVVGDLKRDRLVAVSPDGRLVTPFGREGDGPEEFRETSALLPGSGQQFTVIDNGLFRQSELELAGNDIRLISSRRTETQPNEVCRGAEGLISLDYDYTTQRPLHHLTPRGKRGRGFGLPPTTGSNRLNGSLSQGELLCLTDRDQVLLAVTTGDLLLFDAGSGKAVWHRKLIDYLPVRIEERGAGVLFTYAPPPENMAHYPAALHRIGPDHALLILGVQRRETLPGGKARIFTDGAEARVIDLATGAEVSRQTTVPVILAIRDSLALIKGDDPEPWIGLAKIRVTQETRH